MLREGLKLARSGGSILHHEAEARLLGILRKRYYYGLGLAAYLRAHPGAGKAQVGAVLRAMWRNRRSLAGEPLVAAGMVLMRLLEGAAYEAGHLTGWRRLRRGGDR